MERVFISIGSNLLDPLKQVERSLYMLMNYQPYIRFKSCSSFYRSRPLGNLFQPDFLNIVVMIDTIFSPIELLNILHCIEEKQGRVRGVNRWGPRTLDMDILLFGNKIIFTEKLIIPHYDMLNREFVLYPLFELVPNFRFFNGKMLSEYLQIIQKNGLELWCNI